MEQVLNPRTLGPSVSLPVRTPRSLAATKWLNSCTRVPGRSKRKYPMIAALASPVRANTSPWMRLPNQRVAGTSNPKAAKSQSAATQHAAWQLP